MAFRRGKTFSIYVPLRTGGTAIRGTGTPDRALAKRMESEVKRLAHRREWDLLDALVEGEDATEYVRSDKLRGDKLVQRRKGRLAVGELYDACREDRLEELRARLADTDVEPYVADWRATLASKYGPAIRSSDTAKLYVTQVRTLIPEGKPFYRSALTVERLEAWLSTPAMLAKNSGTRLRHHAAMSSFLNYLVRVRVLERNLMREVPAPKPSDARMRHLPLEEMEALIHAQPAPFNVISALAHCGIELGALLAIRRRDVDAEARTIFVRGTKTKARTRTVVVTRFAWPLVARHIATLMPNALLFEGIGGTQARKAHRAACKALGVEDYRIHDARHSFAVWLIKGGVPAEVIAKALGHSTPKMVNTIYGRFRVSTDDLGDWIGKVEASVEARRTKARRAKPRRVVAG